MKFLVTEEQFKSVISKVQGQLSNILLNEGRNEEEALRILKSSGIENYEEIYKYIKNIDKSKNNKLLPVIASLYVYNPNDTDEIVKTFLKIFKEPSIPEIELSGKSIKIRNNTFDVTDFNQFKDFIEHYFYKETQEEEQETKKLVSAEANIKFENDKYILYEAPSAQVCIKLFGRDNDNRKYVSRNFCIGAGSLDSPGSWYHSHRDPGGSWRVTFYVIVDKEKFKNFQENDVDDSSLINVIGVRKNSSTDEIEYFTWDRNNRGDGKYVEGFDNVEQYINKLVDDGVPIQRAVTPKPYVDTTDRAIDSMVDNPSNDDLFNSLTPKQKFKYVSERAKILTPYQIEFLMKKMPYGLISNFVKNFEKLGDIGTKGFSLLDSNLQKSFINSKLIQLYNNNRLFDKDNFFDYIINDNVKNYAINHIVNSLKPDSKHENNNLDATKEILGLLDPIKLFESFRGNENVRINGKNFKSNELPENLGEYLSDVINLEITDISRIDEIPSSIGQCTKLQTLHIWKCHGLNKLPEEIGTLTNLDELIVSECTLNGIPNSIGNLKNLSILGLNDNYITQVPESIGNCESLQIIKLENNRISNISRETFFDEKSKSFDLESTEIGEWEETFKLKSLAMINLEGNPLDSDTEKLISIIDQIGSQ